MLVMLAVPSAVAQRSVQQFGEPVREDFFGFTGAGLSPGTALDGQLDSDQWRIEAGPDVVCDFGDVCDASTLFGRGEATASVADGGVYAFFAHTPSNPALGLQPTGALFSPGTVTWRLRNDTGVVVPTATISFSLLRYLNPVGGQLVALDYSYDGVEYAPITSVVALEPEQAMQVWESIPVQRVIDGVDWQPGALLYLRWRIDQGIHEEGPRPALALDDIEVLAGCIDGMDEQCDDGNPCTIGFCAGTRCLVVPLEEGTACPDGNACNGQETCDGTGACMSGTPLVCASTDQCTTASCESASGCVYTSAAGCVETDAGIAPDASTPIGSGPNGGDAGHGGQPDGPGTGNAGSAGTAGAGVPDAGTALPDSPQTEAGCSCRTTGGAANLGSTLYVLLAMAWLWIRRPT